MTDRDSFLQAIVEHPDDDAPRLMYADWLTEHGDPRGEFIRTQIALAGMPPEPKIVQPLTEPEFPRVDPPKVRFLLSNLEGITVSAGSVVSLSVKGWEPEPVARVTTMGLLSGTPYDTHWVVNGLLLPGRQPVEEMRRHLQGVESRLLARHRERWAKQDGMKYVTYDDGVHIPTLNGYIYRRGFVEEITIGWINLHSFGAAIFATNPIRKVQLYGHLASQQTLTSQDPRLDGKLVWCWFKKEAATWANSAVVPVELWPYLCPKEALPGEEPYARPWSQIGMKKYDTQEQAVADLSRACVDFGRDKARLPPLTRTATAEPAASR